MKLASNPNQFNLLNDRHQTTRTANTYRCRSVCSKQQQMVSFERIPPNLITVEKTVKEIAKMNIGSNTMLNMRFQKLHNSAKANGIMPKLIALCDKYNLKIKNDRAEYFVQNIKRSEFMSKLMQATGVAKRGNCAEQGFLLREKLLEKGIKSDVVKLEIMDKEKYNKFLNIGWSKEDARAFAVVPESGHAFVVSGRAPNSNIENPHSWGPDSLVGDTWLKIAERANKALDTFSSFFELKEGQCLVFKDFNPETLYNLK